MLPRKQKPNDMPKQNFTSNWIKAEKAPDKRSEIFDTNKNSIGLGLRITPNGKKTFFYRYRFSGKTKRFTIGEFPAISLSDARKEVGNLKSDISRGIDPQLHKQKAKEAPKKETSFMDLCDRFKRHYTPSLRDSTRKEYERIIDSELMPAFKKVPAKELSRKEIIELLDTIAIDRGKTTLSNRVRATLSSIYSFGVDKGIVNANPVLTVKRKKNETKRKRFYDETEIKTLWNAIEKQPEPMQYIYKFLFLCGQRSGETRRMKWDHIDFKNQTWTIPAEETKAKRENVVPLSDQALKILETLHPYTGKSDYVFLSPVGKNTPIKQLQKATERIRKETKKEDKESEIKDFRVHDIRRSVATHMAKNGTKREIIGKILNHKGLAEDDQVTAIYDRYDYLKEKRVALNKWSRKLQQIITGEKAKVHKIG